MMAMVERGRVYEITNLLYFTLTPNHFFIGQGTSIVALLEHNPQTDKTSEMPRDKITLCFRPTTECSVQCRPSEFRNLTYFLHHWNLRLSKYDTPRQQRQFNNEHEKFPLYSWHLAYCKKNNMSCKTSFSEKKMKNNF